MNFSRTVSGNRRRRRAFTLTEVLVAMTIGLVIAGGALSFFITQLKIYHSSMGKVLNNADIRWINTTISRDIQSAQAVWLYRSIDDKVRDNTEGNVAVLLYVNDANAVTEALAYYLDTTVAADKSGGYPLKRAKLTINAGLPDVSALAASSGHQVIVKSAARRDGGTLLKLFGTDLQDKQIRIRADIFNKGDTRGSVQNGLFLTCSVKT